jgi:molybdopterin converting factor small subunit
MVKVHLFGQALRQLATESEFDVELTSPATVRHLLDAHPEQFGEVFVLARKGEVLVTVNRKIASFDTMVNDGDTVKLTHQTTTTSDGARWQNP